MINVSQSFSSKIVESARQFSARLMYGTEEISGEIRSIQITGGACSEGTFTVGAVFSSYIEVVIDECEEILEDKELLLQIGLLLDDGTTEYADIGYYTVTNPKTSAYSTTFTAVGRITSKLNKLFDVPAVLTLRNIANAITAATGITIIFSGEVSDAVLGKDITGMTCKEALSVIAGTFGGFATEDNSGNIVVSKYNTDSKVSVDGDRMTALPEFNDYDYELDGIKVVVSAEGQDEDGNTIEEVALTEGTPRLTMTNEFMTADLFESFVANAVGYTYRPGTVPLALGDPRLQPWDCLEVTDVKGNVHIVPCLNIVHTFDGGLTTTITAPGESESESSSSVPGPITQQLERMNSLLITAQEAIIKRLKADDLEAEVAKLGYASIKELEAVNATIEGLTAKDAEITGKLTANQAEIESLQAKDLELTGQLTVATADITNLKAKDAEIEGTLTAATADITNLKAKDAEIEGTLTATNAEITSLKAKDVEIDGQLTAVSASIGELVAKDAEIESLVAEKADIKDLEAVTADIEELVAKDAEIEALVAKKIDAETVEADYVKTANLESEVGEFGYLKANSLESEVAKFGYAKATDLEATNLTVSNLSGEVASFKTATAQNFSAVNADITEVSGDLADYKTVVAGQFSAKDAEIEALEAKDAEIENLVAENFEATNASIQSLQAEDARIVGLFAGYATVGDLNATNADIEVLAADQADFEEATAKNFSAVNASIEEIAADYITTAELDAESAEIQKLFAGYATVDNLSATNANVTNLTTRQANFENATAENFEAVNADIANIEANYVKTTELEAESADIRKLFANYATVSQLNATNGNIETLSSTVATINSAYMDEAEVESLVVGKGYLTEAQVNTLVAGKGYFTEAQVDELVVGKGYITTAQTNTLLSDYVKTSTLTANYIKASDIASTYATIANLNAQKARIDTIVSDYVKTDTLEANYITSSAISSTYATIDNLDGVSASLETLSSKAITTENLSAKVATLGYLKANDLESEVAEFGYLKASTAETTYATIDNLDAANGQISSLSSKVATIESAYMDEAAVNTLVASKGYITTVATNELLSEYVKTSNLTANYATITSLNAAIGRISNIEADYVTSDMVVGKYVLVEDILTDSLTASTGNFTKYLTGVQIHGDLIYAETLKANSLILQGEDGIYRRLNIDSLGETVVDSDSKYNEKLDGSVLVAESVTATQIAAGTITATQIKSNSITVDRLNANELKARVGSYGYLEASELSAEVAKLGYATADELDAVVGRFSNYVMISDYSTDKSAMQSDISAAQSTASLANTAAGNAQSKADSAYTLANTANGTAITADSKATEANSVLANWCYENNTTYIDGGNIYTGTIAAEAIKADTLSAISADLGTVTAGVIQSTNFTMAEYALGENGTVTVITGLKLDLTNKAYYTPHITMKDNYITLNGYMTIGKRSTGDIGTYSFAQGLDNIASGWLTHAEGYETEASEQCAHAEGRYTVASGPRAHAEGYTTTASGQDSHAEGSGTTASAANSHAEGNGTTASGFTAHAEGQNTVASGHLSHAEGNGTTASGDNSHAEGVYTIAASERQHAQGKYNIADSDSVYAHIVGNGTSDSARSNAHTLDWSGNAWYAGDVIAGGTQATDGTVTGGISLKNHTHAWDAITGKPSTFTPATHTHNYAGSSSAGGAATVALTCTGNSATATKATQDGAGNVITDTYATKEKGVYYIEGTGTTAGTWLGTDESITEYFDGLTIAYKINVAGASTTTLNINGLGAITVRRNTSALTTHLPVNTVVLLVYTTISGTGYWVWADYSISNQVRQYYTTADGNYPLLSKYDAGITTTTSYVTKYSRYSNKFYINPSTGVLTAPTFAGDLTGNADTATTATKLATARTISLTGSVTGSGTFDGSGNLSIATTTNHTHSEYATAGHTHSEYALASHTHSEYALASHTHSEYAATSHTHSYLPLSGGTLTGQLLISTGTTQSATKGIKWSAINSKNPYIGYATDQTDGTFVVASILGTNYASGLAIGGGSGNLLYKGNVVLNASNYTSYCATAGHTHNYAGASSAGGSATSAVKLDTATAGSATQPVYFTGGKPSACTYTLGKSVPSDAVFTDTTYSAATTSAAGLMSAEDKAKLDATNVAYGTCATAAATAAKEVTLSGNDNWELTTGAIIMVSFTNSNTASSVTINVNGTGAYPIWYNNAEYTSTGTAYTGYAGRVTTYMFNGTHWVWVSNSYDANTQSNTNSTNTSSKIFLVGATSQGSNKTTYSHDTVYVGTDGHAYSNSKQVVNLSDTQALTNKTYNGYTLGAACAKGVDTTATSGSANLITSGAMYTALAGKAASSHTHDYLPLSGGTITGSLTVNGAVAVSAADAITMESTDSIIQFTNKYASVALNTYVYDGYYEGGWCPTTDYDGTVALGQSNRRWYKLYATTTSIGTSDRREKSDITAIKDCPDMYEQFFDKLVPTTYTLNIEKNKDIHIGFIAQDIVKSLDELGVSEETLGIVDHEFWTDEKTGEERDRYGLAYSEFTALNTYMIQKQKAKVEALDIRMTSEIDIVKAKLDRVQIQLDAAMMKIAEQEKQIEQLVS